MRESNEHATCERERLASQYPYSLSDVERLHAAVPDISILEILLQFSHGKSIEELLADVEYKRNRSTRCTIRGE